MDNIWIIIEWHYGGNNEETIEIRIFTC